MTKLAALMLLAATSTASANTLVVASDGLDPRPPAPREVDARIGMLAGGSDVGDADGGSLGASAGLGYRVGDVSVRALLDYYKVGDDSSETLQRKGRATRLGGALRYSFANAGWDAKLFDFWGELGGGYEHVAWRHGGVLDRPSGEFAFGFDAGHRGDANARGDRKKIGVFVATRALIAHAPVMTDVPATCSGPCSEPSKPSRTDISLFFELGVHWGR